MTNVSGLCVIVQNCNTVRSIFLFFPITSNTQHKNSTPVYQGTYWTDYNRVNVVFFSSHYSLRGRTFKTTFIFLKALEVKTKQCIKNILKLEMAESTLLVLKSPLSLVVSRDWIFPATTLRDWRQPQYGVMNTSKDNILPIQERINYVFSSVVDPWHFGAVPDPRTHASD